MTLKASRSISRRALLLNLFHERQLEVAAFEFAPASVLPLSNQVQMTLSILTRDAPNRLTTLTTMTTWRAFERPSVRSVAGFYHSPAPLPLPPPPLYLASSLRDTIKLRSPPAARPFVNFTRVVLGKLSDLGRLQYFSWRQDTRFSVRSNRLK